ncbi:MAG: hypothetical protein WDN72_09005 [Alphaproteobacteria bacterium]
MAEDSSSTDPRVPHSRSMRADEYYNTVHVDDYYDKVHRSTWTRRTAGFLGGATMGVVYGGIIGAIGAYLPHVLGMLGVAGATAVGLPALTVVATAAATCALVGVAFGMVILPDVAANSASISAGLEEFEKRHKTERMLDGGLVTDKMTPVTKGDEPTSARIAPHTKLFSWKVAAVTVPLFAAFGIMVALAGIAPVAALAGLAAHSTASVVAAGAMFGMFGSLMAIKNSLISNKITNFYFKVLTEQYFEKKHPAHAVERQAATDIPEMATAPALREAELPEIPARDGAFTEGVKRAGAAGIMASREREQSNAANSLSR